MFSVISKNVVVALLMCSALSGCGRDTGDSSDIVSTPRLTAASLGEQQLLSRDDYLSMPEYRDTDDEWGARLSMQCRACHSLEADGPHLIGPNLYGFFGRVAGSVDGFPYSRAMRSVDFVWTPRALDAWLASPADFLPGSSMSYAGLPDETDRRALIASLLRQTGD